MRDATVRQTGEEGVNEILAEWSSGGHERSERRKVEFGQVLRIEQHNDNGRNDEGVHNLELEGLAVVTCCVACIA